MLLKYSTQNEEIDLLLDCQPLSSILNQINEFKLYYLKLTSQESCCNLWFQNLKCHKAHLQLILKISQ